MKLAFLVITTFILAFISLAAAQGYEDEQGEPIPSLFRTAPTELQWEPGHTCAVTCQRRYIGDWSASDFQLYSQLFLEAENRGWVEPFATEHNYDCSDPSRGGVSGCLFHNSQNFPPWHRMFTYHFEQLLQMIDNDLNPGRAASSGAFCLPYFNWGYNVFFSNNPVDYTFAFSGSSLGTLVNGPIPDSPYANLVTGGVSETRGPTVASNEWSNAQLAACLSSSDIECNNDGSCGFRPCLEYSPHNAFHNDVGGNFASFESPGDPLFWAHHAGVDYFFDLYLSTHGTGVPANYDHAVPRPYDNLNIQLTDTFPTSQFCYSYAPAQNTNAKKALKMSRKMQQAGNATASAPGSSTDDPNSGKYAYNSLSASQKKFVDSITSGKVGAPKARPLDGFTMLFNTKDPQLRADVYASYLKAVDKASQYYATVQKKYNPGSFQQVITTISNAITNAVQSQSDDDVLSSIFSGVLS